MGREADHEPPGVRVYPPPVDGESIIAAEAHVPLSERESEIIRKEVDDAIDITAVLPAWPFRRDRGNVDIFQFEMLFSWDFPVVLQSIAEMRGDVYVTLMAVDQHGERIEPVWRITVSPNMAGPYGYAHYPNRNRIAEMAGHRSTLIRSE